VDVFAHEIATYADQQPAIRFVADAGEVEAARDAVTRLEQERSIQLDAGIR